MSQEFASLSTLATAYFPTASQDVIGIYDQNFSQVIINARPVRVSISPSSKVMEHPVEDGSVISDFTIFNPIEIEFNMILWKSDYREVYADINRLYKDRTILTVQTFADSYSNMIITDLPHSESADIFNALALTLKMKQVLFVTPEFSVAPKDKRNSKTVNKGVQQAEPAPTSALVDWIG